MIAVEMPKNISSDTVSTIVVMNGEDITAGSNPHFFASIGSVQPIIFAKMISTTRVRHIARSTISVISLLPSSN